VDLRHARELIEAWRVDYNTVRPHSSLGYRTPEEFAAANGRGIDIGKRLPVFPVTPPYMRVRIRRFGGLSYRVLNS